MNFRRTEGTSVQRKDRHLTRLLDATHCVASQAVSIGYSHFIEVA